MGILPFIKFIIYFKIQKDSGYEKMQKLLNGKIIHDWIQTKQANDTGNVQGNLSIRLMDRLPRSITINIGSYECNTNNFTRNAHITPYSTLFERVLYQRFPKGRYFRRSQFWTHQIFYLYHFAYSQYKIILSIKSFTRAFKCDAGKVKNVLAKDLKLCQFRDQHSTLNLQSAICNLRMTFLYWFNGMSKRANQLYI
jgi:hypothetical protein